MDNEGLTQYTRIAISLAERIASGQLKEGDKLSGRSKLSPEYNVSPETIRRTLRLLADMKVVEVKEQSGVYVLSADNARRYLHNFADQTDIRGKQQQLKELLVRQEHLNRQMAALCRDILDETSQTPDALPNYYCRIPDDWPHSGTHRWGPAVLAGYRCHHRGHPPAACPTSSHPVPMPSCTPATR